MRNVSVFVLFSKNDRIGSKIIRFFTKNENKYKIPTPSHVALLIDERWVFESTAEKGIHITPYSKWLNNNEICFITYLNDYPYEFIKKLYRSLDQKKYDWLGLIYLSIWTVLNRLFCVSLPERNCLERSDKYFCTEVLEHLIDKDLSMYSPTKVMIHLIDKDKQS